MSEAATIDAALAACPDLRAEPDYYDFLDMPAVEAMTALSHATIYAKIRAGEFPPGRKVGPQAVRWYRGEVRAWNRSRPSTASLAAE